MPSYYIPKKNRCYCDCSGNCPPCQSPFSLQFATSSSLHSSTIKSSVVHTSYESSKNLNGLGKGYGNTRKMGSGGNSYSDYMSRKKGNITCNCNVKK